MKLEVVTLPVSDVDRAKRFYQSLGWRLDADFDIGDEVPARRSHPTDASIAFGKGVTTASGSAQRWELVVSDSTRHVTGQRGVEVSECYVALRRRRVPAGPGPERRSYQTYASFTDRTATGPSGGHESALIATPRDTSVHVRVIYASMGDASVPQLVERAPMETRRGARGAVVVVSGVNPAHWKSRSGSGGGAGEPTVPTGSSMPWDQASWG